MKVYCFPADRTGCGTYRLIWVSQFLATQGHDVEVVLPAGRGGDVGLHGTQDQRGNLLTVDVPDDADVMVFQRVAYGQLAQAVPLIRAKGVAVVVDMDDDLTCIDPRNQAWTAWHPKHGVAGHSWTNATRACMDATLVTVSTAALLRPYAPHGRGVVLDNYVPESYLDVEHVDSPVIGWPGSVHSHPGDLPMAGASVSRLLREGHRFLNVGNGEGVRDALGLPADPDATGFVDLDEWPRAVTRIGVGMAPLADTRFNQAKSRLKALELSACGVPWIASPRAEYARFHREHPGVGLLADKPSAWLRHLKALATDEPRRLEMSAAGREAAAKHTIEANAWRWMTAWEDALKLQRGRRATSPVGAGSRHD